MRFTLDEGGGHGARLCEWVNPIIGTFRVVNLAGGTLGVNDDPVKARAWRVIDQTVAYP